MKTNSKTTVDDILAIHAARKICEFKDGYIFWSRKLEFGNFYIETGCYLAKVTESDGTKTYFTNNRDGARYYIDGDLNSWSREKA